MITNHFTTSLDDLLLRSPWRQPGAPGVVALMLVGAMAVTMGCCILRRRNTERAVSQAVEHERTRVSRDLHDSLGAVFAEISLLSSLAESQATAEQAKELSQIQRRAKTGAETLKNIVWAMDPAAGTVTDFIDHAAGFASDYLSAAGIRCEICRPPSNGGIAVADLSPVLRHHAILAIQETVRNAATHAAAEEVRLGFEIERRRLRIWVNDNGCGTCPQPGEARQSSDAHRSGGHGLRNLQARLESIGGGIRIDSDPGRGTSVLMDLPLQL